MMMNLPCLMASCANFLRPTYSFTECQLSFLTGSCPKEKIPTGYSSSLFLISLTCSFSKVLINSGRYALVQVVGLIIDEVFYTTSLSGFFPEPCSISEHSGIQQGPGLVSVYLFSYAADNFSLLWRFMSVNIFFGSYVTPLVKIVYITLSTLHAITINDCIFFNGFSALVV